MSTLLRPLTRPVLVTVLAAGVPFAAAHEIAREEITITGHPLGSTVVPGLVVDRDELLKRSTGSVGEAVAREPGVTVSDFGPGVGQPVIRGLSGNRVRVLNDGIGSLDVSGISPDHAVAGEALTAEQIEIYRGPATLLYGSGASGGFVNIDTGRIPDRVPERPTGTLMAEYDSALNGWQGSVEGDAGAGIFAVHFEAMRRDTDDVDIPGFGPVEPDAEFPDDRLVNSFVETTGVSGGVSAVTARGFLGVAVSHLENDYGIPEEPGGVTIGQRQTRFDVAGELYLGTFGIEKVTGRFGLNDHDHTEFEPGGEAGTRLENDEWEGRVEVHHDAVAGFSGVVGLQLRDREFVGLGEEAFVPPSNLTSVGVFALERRDVGPVELELGARYEHQDSENEETGRSVDDHLFNVSGGVIWPLREGYELAFTATHAQRAPDIVERFAFGPHLATGTFEIGDAGLDIETSNNFEVSLTKTSGRLTGAATAFYNRINDFVFLSETDFNGDGFADRVPGEHGHGGHDHEDEEEAEIETLADVTAELLPAGDLDGLLVERQRQEDATFYGLEGRLGYLVFDDARGRLDAWLWGDVVRGRRHDADLDLPRISPGRIGGELEYTRGALVLGMEYLRVFDQTRTAPLETDTDGYGMLDVTARYTLDGGPFEWTVFARGRNLTNDEARRHVSFLKGLTLAPARSLVVGVRLGF